MTTMSRDWTPLIPRPADEVPFREDGSLRVFGPFVARLDCGHDYGIAKGYTGESAYIGDEVLCVKCLPPAPSAAPKDAVPMEAPAPPTCTVVDVVYSGPVTAGPRRW